MLADINLFAAGLCTAAAFFATVEGRAGWVMWLMVLAILNFCLYWSLG